MKTNTQKNRVNASELSAFDKKVISLAKKNGLQLQRVRYRYGFNVWRISYENELDRDFIAAVFSRLRGVDINESRCVSPANYDLFGHFDIMDLLSIFAQKTDIPGADRVRAGAMEGFIYEKI